MFRTLARQAVDSLRGPTPRATPALAFPALGDAQLRPNVFPDGSCEHPGATWLAYSGAGVWHPGRDLGDFPLQ